MWHERAITGNLDLDTLCRSGTDCDDRIWLSGRIDHSFIRQHDGNSVANRVDAAALGTLQTLALVFQCERFLADGTDQDVEQVLRNHGGILRFLCGGTNLGGMLVVAEFVTDVLQRHSELAFQIQPLPGVLREWTGLSSSFFVLSSSFSVPGSQLGRTRTSGDGLR